MRCHVCGAIMKAINTDLPFKISEKAMVIIKEVPVIQCENCHEYLIEDASMEKVETILERANHGAELEIIRFAA